MFLDRKIEIALRMAEHESRESFWAFRQYIRPKDKLGWWQREICRELQKFAEDYFAGLAPRLVIEAPPQHGKSVLIVDFIAWLSGRNPDTRTIYASFSERLGIRANLRLQKLFDSEKYKSIFPSTSINESNAVTRSGQVLRNREIIEFSGHEGYFRNTTVMGSITGESLDIGVVDDPLKGREQAGSLTIRNKTWDWFTDDFFSRFSESGAMLFILTRWHIDDPVGRLRLKDSGLKVLSYPAIAINDEKNRKVGEALFPEHKSIDFLLKRKEIMPPASWLALYQQSPVIVGGELIRGDSLVRYGQSPIIEWRMMFADTAMKTKERNDYSALQVWGLSGGKIYLLDQIRGKWEAPELKRRAKEFWVKHASAEGCGSLRSLVVEDKASGTGLIQEIQREGFIPVVAKQRGVDKYSRVSDVLSYIEAGLVCIPANAPFTSDFVAECEAFTADNTHMHDDQIDPMIDAITDMLAGNKIAHWENIF